VINNQADLLLGYVMDQAISARRDAQAGVCDPLRRLRREHGQLRHRRAEGHAQEQARHGEALHARATKSLEEAAKNPEAAIDAMLKAQPKSGVQGHGADRHEADGRLYKGPDNPNDRPFRVGAKNMAETMTLLVDYGGTRQSERRQS
jgi:NitT/TauT family transport system substrate-binding protein